MPAQRVRVAAVDELPPGKGKTLVVAGQELTVYNSEGRYVATATPAPRASRVAVTHCDMPGHSFSVGPAMSPDRLRSDDRRYDVLVEEGAVYVVVDEPAP